MISHFLACVTEAASYRRDACPRRIILANSITGAYSVRLSTHAVVSAPPIAATDRESGRCGHYLVHRPECRIRRLIKLAGESLSTRLSGPAAKIVHTPVTQQLLPSRQASEILARCPVARGYEGCLTFLRSMPSRPGVPVTKLSGWWYFDFASLTIKYGSVGTKHHQHTRRAVSAPAAAPAPRAAMPPPRLRESDELAPP